MNVVRLLLALIAQTAAQGSQLNCAGYDISVQPRSPSFGGVSGFYSIAKGISDGLQTSLSDKTLKDINSLVFGDDTTTVTTGQVITDVVKSQAGAIVFWSIGFVIILAALIFGFTTCCCQLCCGSKNEEDETRSKLLGGIYVFLLVAAFAFIITGIIIFNISATNLYSAIDNEPTFSNAIQNDLNRTLINGTMQMTCTVNQTTTLTFNNIENILSTYSTVMFANVSDQVGLTKLNQDNLTVISQQIDSTVDAGTTFITDANQFLNAGGAKNCHDQVKKLLDIVQQNQVALTAAQKQFKNVANPLEISLQNINKNIAATQNQVQQQIDSSIVQMNSAQADIASSMDNVQSAVNQTIQEIQSVVNALNSAQRDTVTWNGYGVVQNSVRAAMTTPSAIALFFAFLGVVCVLVGLLLPSYSDSSRGVASVVTLVGFYAVVFLTVIAMAVASSSFVLGWGLSAVCEPVFQDPSFRFFNVIGKNITITGFNGAPPVFVNISDIFIGCRNNQTLFETIDGQALLSTQLIDQQLNLTQYQEQVDQQIDSANFNLTIDPNALQLLQSFSESLQKSLEATAAEQPFLQACTSDDASKLKTDAQNYYTQLTALTASTNELYIDVYNVSNSNISGILKTQNDVQFNLAYTSINSSINGLIYDLSNNVFKCQPLYQIYENSGNVICQQFGEPIHGIWAAAGLAAIMFLPLAIVLLCTYRWLRKRSDVETWRQVGGKRLSRHEVGTLRSNALDEYVPSTYPENFFPRAYASGNSVYPETPYFDTITTQQPIPRIDTSYPPADEGERWRSDEAWGSDDSERPAPSVHGLRRRLEMKKAVWILAFVVAVSAFDSQLNYGCNSKKCTFQFVLPEEVARYVDPAVLTTQLSQITRNLNTLTNTVGALGNVSSNADQFNSTFYEKEGPVENQINLLAASTTNASSNVNSTLKRAQDANAGAAMFPDIIACFKNSSAPSSQCLAATTTVAPTTVKLTTLQSLGTTVKFTGSTTTGPTGGTTISPGDVTTGTPVTGKTSTITPAGGSSTQSSTVTSATTMSTKQTTVAPG
ncbi:unnamed protein product [Caenorhabditis auriculariae]|uniref:Uncharacterized protein n=1 Tax=Caenorhabditis auriculariae TaxID=2777116 RepID=A0A8S1H8T5_9PELO|nr:unnamed protein product [Caenorhabditis auriculariae]